MVSRLAHFYGHLRLVAWSTGCSSNLQRFSCGSHKPLLAVVIHEHAHGLLVAACNKTMCDAFFDCNNAHNERMHVCKVCLWVQRWCIEALQGTKHTTSLQEQAGSCHGTHGRGHQSLWDSAPGQSWMSAAAAPFAYFSRCEAPSSYLVSCAGFSA